MNPRSLLVPLCCFLLTLGARAQDEAEILLREARRCTQSLLAGNHDALLEYTHERVIESAGGKAKMLGAFELGLAGMKARGMKFLDAKVGEPQPVQKIGKWLVSVIPQTVIMDVRGSKITQTSHLIGLSSDAGKTWKFIDAGPLSEKQFYDLLPELRGKVPLPPKSEPLVEKPEPKPAE